MNSFNQFSSRYYRLIMQNAFGTKQILAYQKVSNRYKHFFKADKPLTYLQGKTVFETNMPIDRQLRERERERENEWKVNEWERVQCSRQSLQNVHSNLQIWKKFTIYIWRNDTFNNKICTVSVCCYIFIIYVLYYFISHTVKIAFKFLAHTFHITPQLKMGTKKSKLQYIGKPL